MTGELIGAGLDVFYLLWLWVPGIVLTYRIGFRHPLDLLPIGFLLSTAVASLVYSVTYALGISALAVPTTRAILLVSGLIALATLLRSVIPIATAALWASAIALFGVFLRNIFRLDGWMQQADHWLTGWITVVIQAGLGSDIYADDEVVKKGIAFPVIYGLGRQGLYLAAVPTVALILIVLATFRLVTTILTSDTARGRAWIFAGVMALWVSTSMFWGFSTYQHGHGLVALSVGVASRLLVGTLPDITESSSRKGLMKAPTTWMVAAGIFVATFVMAQSRIESFALAMLLALPFLWQKPDSKTWGLLAPRLVAVLGGPIGFFVWFVSIDVAPVTFAPRAVIFAVVFGAAIGAAVILFYLPSLGNLARWGIPLVFTGGLVAYLLPFFGSRNQLYFLQLNTFLGEGLWGYSWWFFLAAGIFLASDRHRTPRENLVLWLGMVAVMFTILIKSIDNFGQQGQGNIREGWSDSVNRTLFHSLSLVTAIGAVAISRILRRFGRAGQGQPRNTPAKTTTALSRLDSAHTSTAHH